MGKISNALDKYRTEFHQKNVEATTISGTFARSREPAPSIIKPDLEWYEDIKPAIRYDR